MDRKKAIIILAFLFGGCQQADDPTTLPKDNCDLACETKNKVPENKNEFSQYELCLVYCDSQKIFQAMKEDYEKQK